MFGCGPVGMFAILSAQLQGAGRVLAVDQATSRLQQARRLGAEVIDFSREDPVQTLRHLTGGTGPDRIIDAVGIDAESLVRAGVVSPSAVISQIGELQGAIEAYEAFDQRREGWHKVVLDPSAA